MRDELCALTGWTRRHARRAWRRPSLRRSCTQAAPAQDRSIGPEVLEPLRVTWATLNGPAGKRRPRTCPRSSRP